MTELQRQHQLQVGTKEWIEKSAEIKSEHNYTCQNCGSTIKPLHVHHKYYVVGRNLWQYEIDKCLATLCAKCHTEEHLRDELSDRSYIKNYEETDEELLQIEDPVKLERFIEQKRKKVIQQELEEKERERRNEEHRIATEIKKRELERLERERQLESNKETASKLEWWIIGAVILFIIGLMVNETFLGIAGLLLFVLLFVWMAKSPK